ncbi:MAG: MMPL family transporter [Anaerolineae bacterium]|nr:MMPL family transporter [Anaerolineae bacterium]
MFFRRIGAASVRLRYPIIAAWIAAAVLITLLAPNLSDVTTADLSAMLPTDAPFNHAGDVYKAAFPDSADTTGAVIVITTAAAEGVLNQAAPTFTEQTQTTAGEFITELCAWLSSDDAPERITGVTCPMSAAEVAGMTIDSSNHVAMIPLNLADGDIIFEQAVADPIRLWIGEHQSGGISTYITGSQAVISAFVDAALTTVERTLIVTVALVVLLLLLIYRSPVSPIIPLAAVTLSYLITRGIVGVLAANVLTVSSYADILLVVVIYGAGTDYCLFLISRFREEVAGQLPIPEATVTTVGNVGETVASSAGTIFVGFTAMVFAHFGVFNASGPTLAIGIIISLVAGLTFVPATLSALGNRAFWPGTAKHRTKGKFYATTSNLVSRHPALIMIIIIAVMLPLGIYGFSAPLSYSSLEDLPDHVEAKAGFSVLEDTLGPGNLAPLTVVVTNRDPVTMTSEIVQLESDLLALDGVADVMSLNNPVGQSGDYSGLLRVDSQLRLMGSFLSLGTTGELPDLQSINTIFAGMQQYLDDLAVKFPGIADDPDLLTLKQSFTNVLSYAQHQADVAPAFENLATRFGSIDDPYFDIGELANLMPADSGIAEGDIFTQLIDQYLSKDRQNYRMTVILAGDPNSGAALDTLLDIRAVLDNYENGGEAVVTGQPAMLADLRDMLNSDLVLTIGVVSLGIFLVLLVMLRSFIAPLYLIATVSLSYSFTMGITDFVFRTFFGAENGLSFVIPVFCFVFLVALGVDYSIFLMGRVKEEVAHRGIRDGIHEAVVATGPIITSAGIILAGTFGSMIFGDVAALAQLGFSVAVGILIDTLVVRTMLVPAITLLLGKWAWWPSGNVRVEGTPKSSGDVYVVNSQ